MEFADEYENNDPGEPLKVDIFVEKIKLSITEVPVDVREVKVRDENDAENPIYFQF